MNETLTLYVATHDAYAAVREEIKSNGGDAAVVCRIALGMSVRKFARLLGVSPSWWSKVERGQEILPVGVARKLLAIMNAAEM